MGSLFPVLRAGATLAALLISGLLIRKVVSEYTQPVPSDKGRKPGHKLGENPEDVFSHGGFDGSSSPEPSEARRRAAEAAQARASGSERRAPGALGRLLRQQRRQTMHEIMRQAAKDEARQREEARLSELWS